MLFQKGFAMTLAHNWKDILRRAWSVRLMLIAALLSGIEVSFQLWGGGSIIPPGVFAALSGLFTAAAFVARLIAQKGITDADKSDHVK